MELAWNSNTGQASKKTVTQGGRELGGQNIPITSSGLSKKSFILHSQVNEV